MNRKISKLTALAILSAFCIAVSLGLSNERIQAETVSGVPFVSAASSAAAQQAQAGWCVKNAQIAASVNADGKVSVFRLDGNQKPAGGPFAEFQLPADGKFTRQAPNCVSFTFPDHRLTFLAPNDGTPVLRVGLCPLRTAEARTVKNLRLPEIRLSEEFAADSVKALGTAGLTPVDGHKGSGSFFLPGHRTEKGPPFSPKYSTAGTRSPQFLQKTQRRRLTGAWRETSASGSCSARLTIR